MVREIMFKSLKMDSYLLGPFFGKRFNSNINMNYATKRTIYNTGVKWDQQKDLMGSVLFQTRFVGLEPCW